MNPEVKQIVDDLQSNYSLPIDLNEIIHNEGNIRVRPANYGEKFDGRIEYIPSRKIFILYHQKVITPRTRFSIAHELGHYYIPEHRALLLKERVHDSQAGFISSKRIEKEADEFAANLLIPENYLKKITAQKKFLTLKDILQIAGELQVSATAMAIRYTNVTPDRCAIILSQNGCQVFYLASEEMEHIGFKWRGCKDIPQNSATSDASQHKGSGKIFEKSADSTEWFSNRKSNCDIWEEAFPLGYTGLVLTMLADQSYNG